MNSHFSHGSLTTASHYCCFERTICMLPLRLHLGVRRRSEEADKKVVCSGLTTSAHQCPLPPSPPARCHPTPPPVSSQINPPFARTYLILSYLTSYPLDTCHYCYATVFDQVNLQKKNSQNVNMMKPVVKIKTPIQKEKGMTFNFENIPLELAKI